MKTTDQKTKIEETAKRLIDKEIYAHVSNWVEKSLETEMFSWDDIENLNVQSEEEELEQQEIYEWYLVSEWLLNPLRELGEPVISNDYGNFWGRTCCGQSIELDGTFQQIAQSIL